MDLTEKARLREQLRTWRNALSRGEVQERSRNIIDTVCTLIPWNDIENVHVYVSMMKNNEPDTWPLLEKVWQKSPTCKVAVPVMRGDEMASTYITTNTAWHTTSFGVPEPSSGPYLPPATKFNVILVPMLGFTDAGYRLGYGGGYYDKFLAKQPEALTIGLCYDEGRVSFSPEKHDVPLKFIVTDRALYRASRMV